MALAYYEICQFFVNYESVMLYSTGPRTSYEVNAIFFTPVRKKARINKLGCFTHLNVGQLEYETC
jgi:hypothetical protein